MKLSVIAILILITLSSNLNAQTFIAKGGLIKDAEVTFGRTLFPTEIDNLSEKLECDHFGLYQVCINVQHDIWLSNRHGHYSKSYSSTCFSMDASDGFIYDGTSTFTGNFIPDGNLNNINNGQSANGVWFLVIEDLQEGSFGFCSDFSLTFKSNVPCDPSICEVETISNCSCPDETDDCLLLPDLIVLEKNTRDHLTYFPSSDKQYPNQIRFSASMANIGHGPLEVVPTQQYYCNDIAINDPSECTDGVLFQGIKQNIYHKKGEQFEIQSRPANNWYFDDKRGHNHYHVDGWTDFKLLRKRWWTNNPDKWKVINSSSKVSYCLMDSNKCLEEEQNCTLVQEVYGRSNLSNYGLGNYFRCNQQIQGISVGAVDNYGMFYEGQYIDIPEKIKPGIYYLFIEVDPENYYKEENEQNNAILIKVKFNEKMGSITLY